MESVQTTPPNCRILNNSPALHSLKRQQLVQLCKRNGIKASGKNTELIGRLKSHASDMSDITPGDGDKENKRIPLSRPSETWSVIEEDSREIKTMRLELKNIREEVEQEMPTQSTLRGFGGSSFNEYNSGSTNSKNSTITSSFRVLANSLKKVGNKMSTGPAQTSVQPMSIDELATMEQVPELTTPIKTRPSPLPSPATGNENDTRDVSIRDLGESTIRLVSTAISVPSPPALRPFTPTFEACYSPESQASPSRRRMALDDPSLPGAFPGMISTPSKPDLQTPAPPSFVFGSPAYQTSNTQFHSAAASVLAEMNARLGLTGTTNEVGINILDKKNTQTSLLTPLSSQMDKPKTDITHKFDKVHEQQFQQMEGIGDWYARKHEKAMAEDIPNKKRKSDALAGPSKRVVRPSNGRRSSRGQALRVVSQTVDEHSKERQAKRPKISFVDKPGTVQIRENAPEPKVDSMEGTENQQTEEEKEKERNAIKKRLEVSRARRRSSMGRVSVGANKPALIPNQAKKGIATRFGFLSSAKNLVKNVWNRAGPQKEEPKPKSAVPVPIQKKGGSGPIPSTKVDLAKKPASFTAPTKSNGSLPAKKLSIRSSTVSTSGTNQSRTSTVSSTNSGSHRAAIPSFSRLSALGRTSSLIRKEGSNANNTNGTHRSQGGSANSIGFKKPGGIAAGSGNTRTSEVSNLSGASRKRTSTLLAPTASSLARMHQTVKPPSLSAKVTANPPSTMKATSDPAPTPSRIPMLATATPRQVSSKEDNNTTIERTPGTIFTSGPPSFPPAKPTGINGGQTAAPKPRPLPGRRPRISRSRVIARVGAQRIASQPEKLNPNNGRRSLNTAKTRGSLGVRVSGIGSKTHTRESLANHRKRLLRQSEIVRRRSKMSSIGAVAPDIGGQKQGAVSSDEMEED